MPILNKKYQVFWSLITKHPVVHMSFPSTIKLNTIIYV